MTSTKQKPRGCERDLRSGREFFDFERQVRIKGQLRALSGLPVGRALSRKSAKALHMGFVTGSGQ